MYRTKEEEVQGERYGTGLPTNPSNPTNRRASPGERPGDYPRTTGGYTSGLVRPRVGFYRHCPDVTRKGKLSSGDFRLTLSFVDPRPPPLVDRITSVVLSTPPTTSSVPVSTLVWNHFRSRSPRSSPSRPDPHQICSGLGGVGPPVTTPGVSGHVSS